jgi:hypothetical protein
MLVLVFVACVVDAANATKDTEGMLFLDASLAGIGVVIAGMVLKPK